MNDELPKTKSVSTFRQPLEQRFADRPDLLARLHELADTLDQSGTDDCTADQAEDRVSAQVRQLALEVLAQWAREAHDQTQAQIRTRYPQAIQYGKKNADVADHLRLGVRRGNAVAAGPPGRFVASVL